MGCCCAKPDTDDGRAPADDAFLGARKRPAAAGSAAAPRAAADEVRPARQPPPEPAKPRPEEALARSEQLARAVIADDSEPRERAALARAAAASLAKIERRARDLAAHDAAQRALHVAMDAPEKVDGDGDGDSDSLGAVVGPEAFLDPELFGSPFRHPRSEGSAAAGTPSPPRPCLGGGDGDFDAGDSLVLGLLGRDCALPRPTDFTVAARSTPLLPDPDIDAAIRSLLATPLPSGREARSPFAQPPSPAPGGDDDGGGEWPSRHALLAADEVLCAALDEVRLRDDARRREHFDYFELRLLECQQGALVGVCEFARLLLSAHAGFTAHWLERLEFRERSLLEQEHMALFAADCRRFATRTALRRQYEGELARMRLRDEQRRAAEAVAAAAAAEARLRASRVAWAIEKDRVKASLLPGGMGAVQRLHAELHAAREEAATSVNANANAAAVSPARPSRRAAERATADAELHTAETRERGSVAHHEGLCRAIAVARAVEAAPFLFPDECEALSARQQVALIEAKRRYRLLLGRCEPLPLDGASPSSSSRTAAACATAGLLAAHNEHIDRCSVATQERLELGLIAAAFADERATVAVHDARREAIRREEAAAVEAEHARLRSARLLQVVGRNFKWRRALGLVHAHGEEAKMWIEQQRFDHKYLVKNEAVLRGDIRHYMALMTRLRFAPAEAARMVTDVEMYAWTGDCALVVESLERDKLEAAFARSLEQHVGIAMRADAARVRAMSPEMQWRRDKAARVLQRALRAHVLRQRFARTTKTQLLTARLTRLRLRAEHRSLLELEGQRRAALVEEHRASDLCSHALRDSFLARRVAERGAAVRIQRAVRQWLWRTRQWPPQYVRWLVQRLHRVEARVESKVRALQNETADISTSLL